MDADKCAGKVDEGKVEIYIQNGDTRSVISADRRLPRRRGRRSVSQVDSRKKGEKPRNNFIVGREKDRHGGLVRRMNRILRT